MVLWLVCIVIFVIGQSRAPENYHLMSGNPWGALFGTSVVLGIIFFCLMILFMFIEKEKPKAEKKVNHSNSKYNFSIGRIISRLALTGVIGIVFGIAMFPFMRVADGLLYQQRASIGSQNIIKMIVLWGVFTAIVTALTFWRKRFRMTSVLLIGCWIISILFGGYLFIRDASSPECKRATPYTMPKEFTRALDLISQRMGIDERAGGTVFQSAFNYLNCLDIQYLPSDSKETEGYFIKEEGSNLQDLKINVNPSYKNFDDLTLATLLSHELIHAGQHINEVVLKTKLGCYESEAQAFVSQAQFMSQLNDEERRSIYARLRENIDKNPAFTVFLLTDQRVSEAYSACQRLQKENNLNQNQFNECVWTGAQNKIEKDVRDDAYYQKQCAG